MPARREKGSPAGAGETPTTTLDGGAGKNEQREETDSGAVHSAITFKRFFSGRDDFSEYPHNCRLCWREKNCIAAEDTFFFILQKNVKGFTCDAMKTN